VENRRTFLGKSAAACLALCLPVGSGCAPTTKVSVPMKTTEPKNARVLWYSQTGNTRRVGQAIAAQLRDGGLTVEASDYRRTDVSALGGSDLIVLGSSVMYADVPVNLRSWLEELPNIEGTAVGSFVTFGGPGDGQRHTAAALSKLAAKRGGVPVGMDMFGAMSTFAPTWSLGNTKRILAYRDLPSAETYQRARAFARGLLARVETGESVAITDEFSKATIMRALPQVALIKRVITGHGVDRDLCIDCGSCVRSCPASAIDPMAGTLDRGRCVACLGCINNCPAGAVTMSFMGKPVYGWPQFLARNEITILEPEA